MGRDHQDGARLRRIAVTTCAAALGVVALVRIGPATADLIEHARRDAPPPAERATAAGRSVHVNTAFVEWVRARIGRRARYWIATASARRTPAVDQWLTFRLLPSEPAERAAGADAVIWYADSLGPHTLPGFDRLERYADGYGVALRR